MADLFKILDGINGSEFADSTLANLDDIINYAEAAGESISQDEAKRIQLAGVEWREAQANGDGEWSRMRHEAIAALD